MSKAIIDVDSFLYRAAITCNELIELEPNIFYEAYNLNKAKEYLSNIIKDVLDKTGCNEYIFVTGGYGKNFRYIINPTYKANRKKQAKPIMLDKVREMMFDRFDVCYIPHLEADDTCRILSEDNKGNVIVSIDKDLHTFSGKLSDFYHDKFKVVTPEQADANFKRQLLMGDKTDGYSGVPKVGPATADRLLLDGITMDEIIEMYLDNGLSIDDFKTTYNCAHILGSDDYNDGIITLYGGEKLDVRTIDSEQ